MTPANWIAISAIGTSLFTPVAIAVLGFLLNKRLKHFEKSIESQKRTSDVRFSLYKDIGFYLNDLFSYFMFVGKWKSHSLPDVVDIKRNLDRYVFTY
jgi:hypothetical protein